MIRLVCPGCGSRLEAPEEAAGGKGKCICCDNVFVVPASPVEGNAWESPSTGMVFIWIPPMGIWAGKYEVTNGEYRKLESVHDSGSYRGHSLNKGRQPVVEVTFAEAKEYAEWMTQQDRKFLPEGFRYRLPAEQEWMSLVQCGDGRRYPWGNDWRVGSGPDGNYRDETAKRAFGESFTVPGYDDGHAVSAPVDELWENPWGLCGMGGNVWEICASDKSDEDFGAWRGACWRSNGPGYLKCSYYDEPDKSVRTYITGFRLVLSK